MPSHRAVSPSQLTCGLYSYRAFKGDALCREARD